MSNPLGLKVPRRNRLAMLACVAAMLVAACSLTLPTAPDAATPDVMSSGGAPTASLNLGGAEHKVLVVLGVIDRTGQPPAGYRGGTQFMNDGRSGGEVLPRVDAKGHSIAYKEWDVNPYTGANRGTERLVTGSDGSAWYTNDHYDSFVRIR